MIKTVTSYYDRYTHVSVKFGHECEPDVIYIEIYNMFVLISILYIIVINYQESGNSSITITTK